MDAVLRAAAIYAALLIIFKIAGRQSLSELTLFDFVLLMTISEAAQQALIGQDYSLIKAVQVIATLAAINIALSMIKRRWTKADLWLEGAPLIVVEQGHALESRLAAARLRLDDVMESAREKHGLERLDQIKFAILEKNGKISIIPRTSD